MPEQPRRRPKPPTGSRPDKRSTDRAALFDGEDHGGRRGAVLGPREGADVLGRVLRDFRRRAGLSQEKLGFAAKLTKNYVSDVEGARRNPTVRVLTQLLDALGVSWEEFGMAFDAARRKRNSA